MAPRKETPKNKTKKRHIEQYDHKGKKRVNNPPVGLVTPQTDPLATTHKTYAYDPHLDPQLQWAGKKEHLSFDVPTVSGPGAATYQDMQKMWGASCMGTTTLRTRPHVQSF